MNEEIIIEVNEVEKGLRIDKFLASSIDDLTRSYIEKLISDKKVYVNDKEVKASYRVQIGDVIKVDIPAPVDLDIKAEDIPLDIIYEDKDIIIINKAKDMVVHPAHGHYSGTLVNALLYHCKDDLSGINGVMRPGIVHRIDKNTTGVIVICKNDNAHQFISEQLKAHTITRKYHAICYNAFKEEEGRIEAPIGRHSHDRKKMGITHVGGKPAATNYRVIKNLNNRYSYVECSLETGRTHQIRVHMASIHHPLLGDDVYGVDKNPFHLEGQALHAKVLGFIHPTTKEYVEFESPLPDYFVKLIEKLDR